ncbi:MAG: hypothetical protein JSS32_06185 [Verrucomicrobia bacterium]|nr:hypothetical protein [Verrucomicrobiota bacterium]
MSVSLDSVDIVSFCGEFDREIDRKNESLLERKINYIAVEKLIMVTTHFHASKWMNIACGSVIVFGPQNWALARKMEVNPLPGSQGHTEGNDSMALGAAMTVVGSLLCLIPGGQGFGYLFFGGALAFFGAGTLERSRAYEKNPNYVPPQLPHKY